MKSDQVHMMVLVAATSAVAVGLVLSAALLSIFVVYLLRSLFASIIQMIAFVCEVIVAVVAAVTSGKVSSESVDNNVR